jgi:hypothetical protein
MRFLVGAGPNSGPRARRHAQCRTNEYRRVVLGTHLLHPCAIRSRRCHATAIGTGWRNVISCQVRDRSPASCRLDQLRGIQTRTVRQTQILKATAMPEPEKTLVDVGGVLIPRELLDVEWARKENSAGLWSLFTVDGQRLATLLSERDIQRWWKQFRGRKGGKPHKLASSQKQLEKWIRSTKPRSKQTTETKAGEGRPVRTPSPNEIQQMDDYLRRISEVHGSPVGDHPADPLRPMSDKYDMPEIDFE